MADTPPLRWLVGTELARHRNNVKLSLSDAAEQSGISRNKIANLELGRQAQYPEDVAALLTAYGVSASEIERLTTLTGRADEAMWWAPWEQVLPDWLRTYVGLEALAERITVFEPLIIHGLLQTPEYAAAVTAHSRWTSQAHIERFVAFRIARSRRLTDPDRSPELHAVIGEGALRLAVGSTDVRREQLRHLLRLADLPSVKIQVVRPEDGPHAALNGRFAMLDFGDAARPIVYLEHRDGAVFLQSPDQVQTYNIVATDLAQVAMSPERSRELIAALLAQ